MPAEELSSSSAFCKSVYLASLCFAVDLHDEQLVVCAVLREPCRAPSFFVPQVIAIIVVRLLKPAHETTTICATTYLRPCWRHYAYTLLQIGAAH